MIIPAKAFRQCIRAKNVLILLFLLAAVAADASDGPPSSAPLSAADITKHATTADGHRIEAIADCARIYCAMQDIEGTLTSQGLKVSSVDEGGTASFAVRAVSVGRGNSRW